MKLKLISGGTSPDPALDPLLTCLQGIRNELAGSGGCRLSSQQLSQLEDTLKLSRDLRCRDELLKQIQEYREGNGETKNLMKSSTEPYILAAFFDVKYAPDPLNLEFFEYEKVEVPKAISDQFSAIAVSANFRRGSPGLKSERVVALFPENWRFKNKLSLDDDDQVYYFNNRFVDRFFKYSVPMMKQFTENGSFSSIVHLKPEEVQKLSALWTWMHEHYHHSGALPLPQFLSYKDSKSAAAFEELRADVGAIANLSGVPWMDQETKRAAMEFILCERLLRYPIQCVPHENYDSVGSQMLFSYLKNFGGLSCNGQRMKLEENWVQGIVAFSKELNRCEFEASKLDPIQGKKHLVQFSKSLGNFSVETGRYELLDFYASCREALKLDSDQPASLIVKAS